MLKVNSLFLLALGVAVFWVAPSMILSAGCQEFSVPPVAGPEKGDLDAIDTQSGAKGRRYRELLERKYQRVWSLVKHNYFRPEALGSWDSWAHRYDGKLKTRDDLIAAIGTMLGSLGDDYTYLLSTEAADQRTAGCQMRHVANSRLLDDGIAYVRLRNFIGDACEAEFRDSLTKVKATRGTILDLRGNHGGYIETAERLFEMLADRGKFISYEGFENGVSESLSLKLNTDYWSVIRNGEVNQKPRDSAVMLDRPLIVLVNEDTRSAAEILAGALRDNNLAMVVGTRTFGKGVLQDRFDVGDGLQIKITTARYQLPNGEDIHNKGLAPDVTVSETGRGDPQLSAAVKLMEEELASDRFVGTETALGQSHSSQSVDSM